MAWLWDNSNDTVALADNAALSFPDNPWTVAGWVKFTDRTDNTLVRRVISWTAGSDEFSIFIEDHSAGNPDKIRIVLEDVGLHVMSPAPISSTAVFLNNTSWTHIVIQRTGDASNCTVTIYINGSSAGNATDNALGAINAAASWYFGNASAGNRPLNGALAEWAKWDRELTADEITGLSKGFAPSFYPASLMWYVPMIREYIEMKVPIVVTNGASTAATTVTDHPRIIYPNNMLVGKGTATAQTLILTGIDSISTLGTSSILLNLDLSGIASLSAFGTQNILLNINPSGIASISSIGTQVLANTQILTLTGIDSTSALGTQSVLLNLDLTGIPSTSSIGTSGLELNLTASGISSIATIGTAGILLNLDLTGLASTSSFGSTTLTYEQQITLMSIASTTAFGSLTLANVQEVLLSGIDSSNLFGNPALYSRSFTLVTPSTKDFELVES